MSKVPSDNVTTDGSDDHRKKTIRKEQKIRTKKKKRKKDLTDLHQRLMKSKKRNLRMQCKFGQSNFSKVLHHFSDRREEYDKEIKIGGKLDKKQSKKMCKRILPRPLSGIYRNGMAGKKIQRFRTEPPVNDTNNARLQGDVFKLLNGYDSKSEIVVASNAAGNSEESLLNAPIRDILQSVAPSKNFTSPILGKVDGKKRNSRNEDTENIGTLKHAEQPQKSQQKSKISSGNLRCSAINKYEELCNVISSENFEEQDFFGHFIDPLTAIKKKLRNVYAETFRSRALLKNRESPDCVFENGLPSEYCQSSYKQDTQLLPTTIRNPTRKDNNVHIPENMFTFDTMNFIFKNKKRDGRMPNLLFDKPLMSERNACTDTENIVDKVSLNKTNNTLSEDDNSSNMSSHNQTGIEENYVDHRKNIVNDKRINILAGLQKNVKAKDRSETVLFVPNKIDSSKNDVIAKKYLRKQRNQYTQTSQLLNRRLRKHFERNTLKSSHQAGIRTPKHIPAILRKCKTKVYLFDEPVHDNNGSQATSLGAAAKRDVLFTLDSIITKSREEATKLEDCQRRLNAQSCPTASPSLIDQELHPVKNVRLQANEKYRSRDWDITDIVVPKKNVNSPVHKTIMFTRKDLRNTKSCVRVNNLITNDGMNSSNVQSMEKDDSRKQEIPVRNNCVVHNNCYRQYDRSEDSHNANYSEQECPDSNAQLQQEPVICEKVLLTRVHRQKCKPNRKCWQKKEQHVHYVVVDQCKEPNNPQRSQNCSNNNMPYQIQKRETIQRDRYCEDDVANIGILKGVQNLKIFPIEEQESQLNRGDQYETVVIEQQPIKYLAFESDSKAKRIPIYMQSDKHVAPVDNVELADPKVNYKIISCPQKTTQKVILLPACENGDVVYVQEQNSNPSNMGFEDCSHPRKVILCRPDFQSGIQCVEDPSRPYEVHVPKQNVLKIKKAELEPVAVNLKQAEGIEQRGGNWEGLLYRPSHAQSIVKDACERSQAVFYRK